jgi:hypothetical protein
LKTLLQNTNGILKDGFYLSQIFTYVAQVKEQKNAITLYNNTRLHLSLDFKTPHMVYLSFQQAGKLSA